MRVVHFLRGDSIKNLWILKNAQIQMVQWFANLKSTYIHELVWPSPPPPSIEGRGMLRDWSPWLQAWVNLRKNLCSIGQNCIVSHSLFSFFHSMLVFSNNKKNQCMQKMVLQSRSFILLGLLAVQNQFMTILWPWASITPILKRNI